MNLYIDYQLIPKAIDSQKPVFGWNGLSFAQTAYQLTILSDKEIPDVDPVICWDSGRVNSSNCTGVPYEGITLEPDRLYHCHLTVWGEGQQKICETAAFRTGMLGTAWPARFIRAQKDPAESAVDTSPRLRGCIIIDKPVSHATAFVYTNCFHELYCGQQRVSDSRLASATAPCPHPETTVRYYPYDTYDLTPYLQEGENRVGLWLGDGYNEAFNEWGWRYSGAKQALILISLRYTDGSHAFVAADDRWQYHPQSPILHNSIYHGEWYDATLESNWMAENDGWQSVFVGEAPTVPLISTPAPPIKEIETLHPIALWKNAAGNWIADMGQNFAGVVRLRVRGTAGDTVILRHAEDIDEHGELDIYTNRWAKVVDTYVLRGDGEEVYQPRFTYHGFRYVEIEGYPGTPTAQDVTGIVMHTAVRETGLFVTDNPYINRIYQNLRWSIRSNMMSYPSDCPCRDERTPCQMDSATYEETAMHIFDMHGYYSTWLRSTIGTTRSPDWSGDYVLLCHHLWRYAGDKQTVETYYPTIYIYLTELLKQRNEQGLITKDFGDWCAPSPTGSFEGSYADVPQVNTALFAYLLQLGSEMATLLNRIEDAVCLQKYSKEVSEAYCAAFWQPAGNFGESLTPNILALAFGIGSKEQQEQAFQYILQQLETTDYTIRTGIYGTRYLLDVLLEAGMADTAYRILTGTTFPSFGWQIDRNATTLWEQWMEKGGMETHNHAMFAGIGAALFTHLAGIQPMEPGYLQAKIKPLIPNDLGMLSCVVNTVRGEIRLHWHKEPKNLSLTVELPADLKTQLILPFEQGTYQLNGGRHTFHIPLPSV